MLRIYLLLPLLICAYFVMTTTPKAAASGSEEKAPKAPEIGNVEWSRGFERALFDSKQTGKPVFALFQEVPGCDGCKQFGQIVLREPFVVEAIESEFIPVLIYNNRSGKDAEILQRYNEPAWNFQVIRFLNQDGKDIIPRKDQVWSVDSLVPRMIEALEKTDRPVPAYLKGIFYSSPNAELQHVAFAQHCFWTGEQRLGGIAGVVRTEAGHYDGSEITRVWYDPRVVDVADIIQRAQSDGIADRVYQAGNFDQEKYQRAPEADQKRQLLGSSWATVKLNEYQRTKLNAFVRVDQEEALSYLSPRQRSKFLK